MPNLRLIFPLMQVGLALDGTTNFTEVHGVQSIGITTNFNLQSYFELGQSAIYQLVEQLPDVEVNIEKLYDGYPSLYHLGTRGATDGGIFGRSNIKSIIAMSLFSDTPGISATGIPIKEVSMSGMYLSTWATAFQIEGPGTETATFVGQNKIWRDDATLGNGVFNGKFNNLDSPRNLNPASGQGIQHRWNITMGPSTGTHTLDKNGAVVPGAGTKSVSVWPKIIPGINASGLNPKKADGSWLVPFQSVSISADFGRTPIYGLGLKSPYARFVNPIIEVRSEIEVLSREGDNISASEEGAQNGAPIGYNIPSATIRIALDDDTVFDLGPDNKLLTVAQSGGEATQNGGNVTDRYSFQTYNYLYVKSPNDPSGL